MSSAAVLISALRVMIPICPYAILIATALIWSHKTVISSKDVDEMENIAAIP